LRFEEAIMRGRLLFGAASAALAAFAFAAPAALAQQSDQPGDASTQARVSLDQPVSSRLDGNGDSDWFRLNVEHGQRYRITLDAAPVEGEGAIDPVLLVHSAEGEQLAFNDDSNASLNSALYFSPAASGEVFVEARGFNPEATGGYTLSVSAAVLPDDDAGNDHTTRSRVTPGRAVNGSLEYEGDADWYRMTVRTGQIYRISLNGAEGDNALGDPLLRVIERDGHELAINDDTNGLNSYVEFTPTVNADVFVVASAYSDLYAGNYTLSVEAERLPPDNASANVGTRGRIAVGGTVEASLEYSGDRDWYRIRLEEGQSYRFALNTVEADNALGDPLLRLYDARGTELAMDDDGGGALNSLLEYTATATGNYYIEARGFTDDASGAYSLRALAGDIPGDATTDTALDANGDYREGMLAPAGDRDWYRVEMQAGQAMRVSLATVEGADALGDPYLVFYGPDGAEIARDDDGGGNLNAWLEAHATTAGPHYLEVRGFQEDAAGRYAIMITGGEIGDSAEGAEYLQTSNVRTSTINTNEDVDWFAIELIEGRPYRFNVMSGDPNGLADPFITLYDSTGTQVASDDDGGAGLNAYLSYASPSGGTHYAAVSSYGQTGSGSYMIWATDTDVPGHIYTDENLDNAGDDRLSRIEIPGDLDTYRVELEAGVRYQIDVSGVGDHPLTDAFVTLLDANGERVTSDDDSGDGRDARLRFTPETSGTFHIQASGLGGSTGSYQVSVTRR